MSGEGSSNGLRRRGLYHRRQYERVDGDDDEECVVGPLKPQEMVFVVLQQEEEKKMKCRHLPEPPLGAEVAVGGIRPSQEEEEVASDLID